MQSVLFLAGRGPDGTAKNHPCKQVHVAYRASNFQAAKYGRLLEWGEKADGFMSLDVFADDEAWASAVKDFFKSSDGLPLHYVTHLMHGAEILGYKHPDPRFRARWKHFYMKCVDSMHLGMESEEEMDERLGDWGREYWNEIPPSVFARLEPRAQYPGGLSEDLAARLPENKKGT